MHQVRELFVQSLLLLSLGLTCRLASAQATSCPLITVDDLGSTTQFSMQGLIAEAIVPPGEALGTRVLVRINDFTVVCDASGDRRNTSSFVSVVVELRCMSDISSLTVCDGSTDITRQYQFQCIEDNGQAVWDTSVSGSALFVETENPTATLSTPLANQCRRCIDDQQSFRSETTNHCDPCPSRCNLGQRRCNIGQTFDVCCNFYLQGNCAAECPSALEADSNFDCVCPSLSLGNGTVSYSVEMGVERNIGSVATHTCNPGYRLSPPLQAGTIPTCSINGWSDQTFTCEQITIPPPQVQALCSVVVWNTPEVSCGDIVGYDVRFFHPQLLTKNVTRRVGANGTFHIVQEEDKLDAKQEDLYVQVRVIHRIIGEWSEGISLGCERPTSPPEAPSVYFVLNGMMYTNNSAISLSEVGEDENALLCKTNKENCCGTPPNRFGEFYYPSDIKVPIAKQQQGFYRNRGEKVIRLNRRDGTISPTGKYRCEIPDASGSVQNIYITLS